MARRKTVTKEQILDTAYYLVSHQGFGSLTARNIAQQIGCSTQPIYLTFKNMGELRDALFERIYKHLEEDIYSAEHTGDPIIDMALNYVEFAKKEPRLYTALFLEKDKEHRMVKFTYDYFYKLVKSHERYKGLDEGEVETLLSGTWVIATGVASLAASGTIHPDKKVKAQLMRDAIQAFSGLDHKIDLINLDA